MKKVILVFISFMLLISYSCKEKTDIEKEKKAIMAVIEEETASYYASDFQRWSSTYLNDSTCTEMFANKYGYGIYSGWKAVSSLNKQSIIGKKDLTKEVKTPVQIKVNGESAWVIFKNETFGTKGESSGISTVSCFLEKSNGAWKIVYRNVIQDDSYWQADIWIITALNYAKSNKKKVDDIANFAADQFKPGWNKSAGYKGVIDEMLGNWRGLVPEGGVKIIEQDSSHILFSAKGMFSVLKNNSPMFNVTYDDYLTFYRVFTEKYAAFMGADLKQETTSDGVLVTIRKK